MRSSRRFRTALKAIETFAQNVRCVWDHNGQARFRCLPRRFRAPSVHGRAVTALANITRLLRFVGEFAPCLGHTQESGAVLIVGRHLHQTQALSGIAAVYLGGQQSAPLVSIWRNAARPQGFRVTECSQRRMVSNRFHAPRVPQQATQEAQHAGGRKISAIRG